MAPSRTILVTVLGIGILLLTAGVVYADPWDDKLTTSRFLILTRFDSQAVLDRETGLVWQRVEADWSTDWYHAQDKCWQMEISDRAGWRLPSAEELRSLLGNGLPAGHPFKLLSSSWWSDSTNNEYTSEAYSVWFGGCGSTAKSTSLGFMCVRGSK